MAPTAVLSAMNEHPPPKRRSARRIPGRAVVATAGVLVALLVLMFGAAWWVADQVWDGAFPIRYEEHRYDIEVISYDEARGTVVLRAPRNLDVSLPGSFGLEWEDGYGALGTVLDVDGDDIEREFEVLIGEPPGDLARIDGGALPGDPWFAHGLEFEDVTYPAEQGLLPAWFIPGDRDTWVIVVHGRTSDRREALRLLPAFAAHDLPVLVITYRNDREVGAEPGAVFAYGTTEWADLEGAVQFALDEGADDVLLVGYSMGGAIAVSFLYRSELAEHTRAVILDAPALSLAAAGDLQMRDGGVPGFLTRPLRAFAAWRHDIDWEATNYLPDADALEAPILLMHGDADRTVPVETSRELARLRPDIVTYLELPGVGHVRGWNEAQIEYLDAVEAFLARVLDEAVGTPR